MPTPMPIGGRSQSVAVGPTVPFVFRRRSQTGPVGSRTLSGNAVYRVNRGIEGSNPSRSVSVMSQAWIQPVVATASASLAKGLVVAAGVEDEFAEDEFAEE